MDDPTIHKKLLDLLVELAPEFAAEDIDLDEDLRDQLDIDSMDLQQLAGRIDDVFGVDIPEAERVELSTARSLIDYLQKRHGTTG